MKAVEFQSREFWVWRTSRQQNSISKKTTPKTHKKQISKTKNQGWKKDKRPRTATRKLWNFSCFYESVNWNLSIMGALYQEGFVAFLFSGPPGMESQHCLANAESVLGGVWARVCLASLFLQCVDILPCALRLFSPISSFLPQSKNFFSEILVLTSMNSVSGKWRKWVASLWREGISSSCVAWRSFL